MAWSQCLVPKFLIIPRLENRHWVNFLFLRKQIEIFHFPENKLKYFIFSFQQHNKTWSLSWLRKSCRQWRVSEDYVIKYNLTLKLELYFNTVNWWHCAGRIANKCAFNSGKFNGLFVWIFKNLIIYCLDWIQPLSLHAFTGWSRIDSPSTLAA